MHNFGIILGLTGLYFFIILAFVVYARFKATKSILPGLNEFFLAGKSLHPIVLVCTYVASLFSTFSVLGMPALAYGHGVGAIAFFLLGFPISILFLVVIGKRFRRFAEGKRIFSPVEIISQSYESRRLGLYIALIFSIFLMPYISLQLVGIGAFIEAYTNGQITYVTCVGSMMVIVAIYLLLGGMRAVAYTDFIQLIAMLLGLFFGVLYLLNHYDLSILQLLESAREQAPEQMSLPGAKGFYTMPMLLTSALILLGIFMQPHLLTRTLMAKNDKEINLMAVGAVIGAVLVALFAGFYGMYAQVTFGGDLKPNLMMGNVFQAMASFGIWGLILSTFMLMGALGASMSTADSLLMAIGQVCTRDVARPFFQISRPKQVLMSKAIMFLVLLGAFLTGLNPPQFMTDLALYSAAGCIILAPTIICFEWKKRSLLASYVSITFGLVLLGALAVYKVTSGETLLGVHVGFLPMMLSFVLFFSISLLKGTKQHE